MADSSKHDGTDHPTRQAPRSRGRRGRYLPSPKVVKELASLGPDLATIADELRNRLSDAADEQPR